MPDAPKEYETGNISAGNISGNLEGSREYASRESHSLFGHSLLGHFGDFLQDEKQIWSSPARVRFSDATWLVPLGGLAAGLFATDRQYSASLPQNPTTIHHYKTVSNFGLASLVGASAGLASPKLETVL